MGGILKDEKNCTTCDQKKLVKKLEHDKTLLLELIDKLIITSRANLKVYEVFLSMAKKDKDIDLANFINGKK